MKILYFEKKFFRNYLIFITLGKFEVYKAVSKFYSPYLFGILVSKELAE